MGGKGAKSIGKKKNRRPGKWVVNQRWAKRDLFAGERNGPGAVAEKRDEGIRKKGRNTQPEEMMIIRIQKNRLAGKRKKSDLMMYKRTRKKLSHDLEVSAKQGTSSKEIRTKGGGDFLAKKCRRNETRSWGEKERLSSKTLRPQNLEAFHRGQEYPWNRRKAKRGKKEGVLWVETGFDPAKGHRDTIFKEKRRPCKKERETLIL